MLSEYIGNYINEISFLIEKDTAELDQQSIAKVKDTHGALADKKYLTHINNPSHYERQQLRTELLSYYHDAVS